MYKDEYEFLWLLNWYEYQCHINKEDLDIITLHTLDNPGWRLTINLENNSLKDKIFNEVKIDRTDTKLVILSF